MLIGSPVKIMLNWIGLLRLLIHKTGGSWFKVGWNFNGIFIGLFMWLGLYCIGLVSKRKHSKNECSKRKWLRCKTSDPTSAHFDHRITFSAFRQSRVSHSLQSMTGDYITVSLTGGGVHLGHCAWRLTTQGSTYYLP